MTIEDFGAGRTVLLLHSEEGPDATRPFAEELAHTHRVLMPHHPGYGTSMVLPWKATVRDLAYAYNELLDAEGLDDIEVIGSALGAWSALELAAQGCGRIASLTLLGPVGIKLSGIEESDFVDVYAISPEEHAQRAYHDPALGRLDPDALSFEDLERAMRHREVFTNYAWEPYLHSTALRYHAARVRVPTLVINGSEDRMVRPGYYAELSDFLPNARHLVIPECGHFPDVERPIDTAAKFTEFTAKAVA
ncbi:alpha/beta fold hydrolase [Nocardia jiangxiensis]|uniref:Alpha/beta fold hydrolase n=1 Tax=Nocardia jiangxiensis TaxID=282685 RepID=A0ABW6RZ56_9NOCA